MDDREMLEWAGDKGPWHISKDGNSLLSDDFHHDVMLRVGGDFGTGERQRYMNWLCGVLNTAAAINKNPKL